MLVLRDLAGIEPLGGVYRALSGSRAARGMLRAEARERAARLQRRTTTSTRTRSGRQVETARSRALAAARADPRAATSPTTRRAASARRGATSGRCAGCGAPDEREPAGGGRGARRGVRLGRRRHRQDVRARRALRPGGLRRGARRRLGARDHLHAQGGRRAARRASAPRSLERGRPDLARELDGAWISTIHGFCARLLRAHPFAAGIDPQLPRARRGAGRGHPRRGVRAGARERSAPARDPERLRLARDLRQRPAAPDAHRRLRDAPLGRPAARARARRAADARSRCSPSFARRRSACSTIRGATTNHSGAARAALDLRPRRSADRPRAPCERAAPRPPTSRRRAKRSSRRRSRSPRRATRTCSRSSSTCSRPSTPPRRSASRRSTSRICSCSRATCLRDDARIREAEQLRFRAIMVDEFQDTNALQCELDRPARRAGPAKDVFFVGDEFQSIYGFRHADVEVFRERARGGCAAAAADRELPLPARGARRGQLPLRRGVRRRLPAARGLGRVPRPGVRPPGRAARHRQGLVHATRASTGAGREARHIARRVRELVDTRRGDAGRDRAALRRRHRRRVVRGGAAGAGAADLPRDRAPLLRPAAGRRPAHVPAPAAQPLRRRGARDRARLAVRRRLERRARADPPPRRAPAALHRDRAGAARGARRPRTSG